jgi:hypothetical protein
VNGSLDLLEVGSWFGRFWNVSLGAAPFGDGFLLGLLLLLLLLPLGLLLFVLDLLPLPPLDGLFGLPPVFPDGGL